MKPKVRNQGRAIVNYSVEDKLYYIMLPDGTVRSEPRREEIEALARKWAKKHSSRTSVNVLSLEWRDCP